MTKNKQKIKQWWSVGTAVAASATLMTVVFLVRAYGTSDAHPVVTNTTSSYNTEDDVILAKELVQMAKVESTKADSTKWKIHSFSIGVSDLQKEAIVGDQLETSGGYVIGIDNQRRTIIPARHIRYIEVFFAAKE